MSPHHSGGICGYIQPQNKPFYYFMILNDASIWWSHVCVLSNDFQLRSMFNIQFSHIHIIRMDERDQLSKCLQVITRTLLFIYQFLYGTFYITCWCIYLWLTTYHWYLPLQLVIGHWIAHIFKIFDCVIYLLISSLTWSKIRILYHYEINFDFD